MKKKHDSSMGDHDEQIFIRNRTKPNGFTGMQIELCLFA